MKVLVDQGRCQGHARCNAVAPALFKLNDDGYIGVDSFEVRPGDEELARRGVRACPERALKLVEDGARGS